MHLAAGLALLTASAIGLLASRPKASGKRLSEATAIAVAVTITLGFSAGFGMVLTSLL
jgi:hypothetical protein